MLQFLPYALAAYGGYKGYKHLKTLVDQDFKDYWQEQQELFRYYQGGILVPGALQVPGFGQAQSFTPLTIRPCKLVY